MACKAAIFLVLAATLASACGKATNDGGDTIQGVPVTGSQYLGMAFAAVNVDPDIKTSRIYYYSFSDGVVSEVMPGESGNPALFYTDSLVFLFNRDDGNENLRTFDPRTLTNAPTGPTSLPDVQAGDPWDVASLTAGKTIALASPLGGALQTLDYTSGAVTSVALPSTAGSTVRPHGLMRVDNTMYVLHSGTNSAGVSDGTQQILTVAVASDGTPTFSASPGIKLSGSNPTGFVNRDGIGGATIVDLCLADWTGCTVGADRMDGETAAVPFSPNALTGLSLINQVVDGPVDNAVFAEVQQGKSNVVAALDFGAGTATAVHTFSDDRLYGIAYDKWSQVLFVGDVDGLEGSITLYKNGQSIGHFDVDGVLYSAAFVTNP